MSISELAGATGLGLQYSAFITGQAQIYLTAQLSPYGFLAYKYFTLISRV